MVRKILLVIVVVITLSCSDKLEYEWDNRVVYEGRIVDQQGNGLSGIAVSTFVIKDGNGQSIMIWGGGSRGDSKIIAETVTDRNGYYRMMFPRPKNEDHILLYINRNEYDHVFNSDYSNLALYHILPKNMIDYKIHFEDQTLFELENTTTLTITPVDIEGIYIDYHNLNYIGLVNDNYLDYNFDIYADELRYDFHHIVTVAKNQDVILRYQERDTVNGEIVITPHEIEIPVANDPVNYTLEY